MVISRCCLFELHKFPTVRICHRNPRKIWLASRVLFERRIWQICLRSKFNPVMYSAFAFVSQISAEILGIVQTREASPPLRKWLLILLTFILDPRRADMILVRPLSRRKEGFTRYCDDAVSCQSLSASCVFAQSKLALVVRCDWIQLMLALMILLD